MKFLMKISELLGRIHYHEYPVYDQDGNFVGYEWHGTRIGGGRVEFEAPMPKALTSVDAEETNAADSSYAVET